LALSNGEKANKSPPRETDSNSNSAQSSPETHLSSACLLVQAAVEPMEQGFKFPKTKKVSKITLELLKIGNKIFVSISGVDERMVE
jgi:hypothetical protein